MNFNENFAKMCNSFTQRNSSLIDILEWLKMFDKTLIYEKNSDWHHLKYQTNT